MLLKTSMNGSELENGSEILELIDVTEEDGALYGVECRNVFIISQVTVTMPLMDKGASVL